MIKFEAKWLLSSRPKILPKGGRGCQQQQVMYEKSLFKQWGGRTEYALSGSMARQHSGAEILYMCSAVCKIFCKSAPKICEEDTTSSKECGSNSAKYKQYKLPTFSDKTSKLTSKKVFLQLKYVLDCSPVLECESLLNIYGILRRGEQLRMNNCLPAPD